MDRKNYELIKKLSGHSGCNILLLKEKGRVFVRKDAGSIAYNRRLRRQCIKQKNMSLKGVKTPKIINNGKNENGVFYFDMEYINGVTLAEYMKNIKIKEIVNFIDILFECLPIDSEQYLENTDEIFKDKISSLEEQIMFKNCNLDRALNKLKCFDWSCIPKSHCCGDLTLENIILSSSGDLYLIDLLDSFYDSWMIDVAKLLQDFELGWSYRNQKTDYNLNLRLSIAKQAILDSILMLSDGKRKVLNIYYLLLLNILRIYPYANKKTSLFLDSSLNKVCNIIEGMEDQ